jgi:ABC-type multidrug transport system ATPase subunit
MIQVRELTKRFGKVQAIDALSFDVLPGRVTGFLGPNGAGKSTTMRLILGLDLPTSGHVTINGRGYGELPRWAPSLRCAPCTADAARTTICSASPRATASDAGG